MNETLAPYSSALTALAILTVATVAQAFLAGLLKNAIAGQPAGKEVLGGPEDMTFRVVRTHMNGVENFAAIAAAVLLAVVAGAAPAAVMWLTWAIVALRLAYWPLYTLGEHRIGPLRSIAFVLAQVLTLVLAALALVAMI